MRLRPAILAGTLACALLTGVRARAEGATVTIDNFAFTPAEITVAPGTTVTWLNRDDIPHMVVDATQPRGFISPPLDTDDSFKHAFDKPGTYHYFCSLHPHMQGTVVVR